jgi:hypothetical protein
MIGLPYAEAGVDADGYYLTCPACKAQCRPPAADVFRPGVVEDHQTKAAAAVYAAHYERQHPTPMMCEHRPYAGAAYHCYADEGHYRPAGHPDGPDMHHDTVICWDAEGRMTSPEGVPI